MIGVDRRNLAYLAAGAVAFLALVIAGDAYALRVATLVGIYAIATIGYQLVFGRLGLLSLAQGALFGIGAYTSALLTLELGAPALLGLPAAIVVPAAVGALVALPIARLESHYVALATLGLAQLVLLAATNLSFTGGANGLYGVPPIAVGPIEIDGGWAMLALVWALVGAALLVSRGLLAGGRGARIVTLRDAPHAAVTLGINPVPARLGLFAVAGALGGLAGGLQAHGIGVVSPSVTGFEVMVTILAIAVVGGRGSATGAVAGAALLVPLPEALRFLEGSYLVAYGVVLLVAIILVPRGLDGRVRDLFPRPAPALPGAMAQTGRHGGRALAVEGLRKSFGGVVALDGVSFAVPAGTVVGLIGANGSGKTTTLNIISGLELPDAGQVRVGGVPLVGRPAHHRCALGLGRSFQHPEFPEDLFVIEAASVGACDRSAAFAALERVGLAGRAADSVAALGAAELRRLDVARSLAIQPGALILDEPAAGLTGDERTALAALLHELSREGLAVLVVDHGMDFLMPLADRIVCLDAGRVLAAGTPEQVRTDPAVIAAYLGKVAI